MSSTRIPEDESIIPTFITILDLDGLHECLVVELGPSFLLPAASELNRVASSVGYEYRARA